MSYSSSESSRTDSNDVMSTHSDTTLTTATTEFVSLSDYALMDEDSLSDYSGARFSRQTSATTEPNVSMHFSQFRGKSLSLESMSTSSNSKGHHKRHRKKLDYPGLQVQSPQAPLKAERTPNVNTPDVPSRNASTKSNSLVKHLYRRAKSLETSGTSSPSGEEKLLQRRLLYNARLELHQLQWNPSFRTPLFRGHKR